MRSKPRSAKCAPSGRKSAPPSICATCFRRSSGRSCSREARCTCACRRSSGRTARCGTAWCGPRSSRCFASCAIRRRRRLPISDAFGPVLSVAAYPDTVPLRVDVAPADAVADGSRYYLRMIATVGHDCRAGDRGNGRSGVRPRRRDGLARESREVPVSHGAAGDGLPAEHLVRGPDARLPGTRAPAGDSRRQSGDDYCSNH